MRGVVMPATQNPGGVHSPEDFGFVPPLPVGDMTYDRLGNGGCTILEFNARTGRFGDTWTALGGTIVNCAGGATPWGTWLTCEETTAGTAAGLEKPHGYVFEVPATTRGRWPQCRSRRWAGSNNAGGGNRPDLLDFPRKMVEAGEHAGVVLSGDAERRRRLLMAPDFW